MLVGSTESPIERFRPSARLIQARTGTQSLDEALGGNMTEQLGGPVRPTTTLRLEGTADDLSVALRRLLTVTAGSMAERAQLEGALESRIVIEQAKGILAERLRLSMSEAFELLRTTARANNTRLRDLAECVVNHPGTPPALLTQLQGDLTTRQADRR